MASRAIASPQHLHVEAQKDMFGGYSVAMLQRAEIELLGEISERSGFRTTEMVAGLKNRWDIIYKAAQQYENSKISLPTRGPAMKNLDIPNSVKAILTTKRISLRQWCIASMCEESRVIGAMQAMERSEAVDLHLEKRIGMDFPLLSKETPKIKLPPKNYLCGDLVIREGYGQYLAIGAMNSGIEVQACGRTIEMSIWVLKAKALHLTRLSSLFYWIYGEFPTIDELVNRVTPPTFTSPKEVAKIRAEKRKQHQDSIRI